MNTFDQQKLTAFLKELNLSQANERLALAYLRDEFDDEELLKTAQSEDFMQLTMQQRVQAMLYLRSLDKSRDRELQTRLHKILWAMGKASAEFVLTDLTSLGNRAGFREKFEKSLGITAAAALEAHYFTWKTFDMGIDPWLHELARYQPQVLEEAQAVSGEKDDRMAMTVAGILLAESGDAALIDRQR